MAKSGAWSSLPLLRDILRLSLSLFLFCQSKMLLLVSYSHESNRIVPKKIKFRRNTKVEEKERISRWTSVLEFGVKLRTVEVEPSGYRALSSSLPPLSNSSREFVKRGFAERKEKKKKKSGGRRREGMCPKRRMHAETRKRYIRGLAAGDGRAGPSFFYLYV